MSKHWIPLELLIYCDLNDAHEGPCQDRFGRLLNFTPNGTEDAWTLSGEIAEGWRECDDCGRTSDAGAWPNWINGSCEDCDPDILNDPENIRTGPESGLDEADAIITLIRAAENWCDYLEENDREDEVPAIEEAIKFPFGDFR